MTKILVLGAGGMAGSMITQYLTEQNYQIYAMFRQDFDVIKDKLPDLTSYEYIINCIGMIKQKSSDEQLLYALNSKFPHDLSIRCKKLIHISSDCVFSGDKLIDQKYTIKDRPDATDSYGRSKADGELIDNAMILRTSIIGPARDTSGLFEWFRTTSQNPVKGFTNHWWSGITTLQLAKTIDKIISAQHYCASLQQIASPAISKYDLLSLINYFFNCSKVIIPHMDDHSINRVLDPTISAPSIETQLKELREHLNEKC